MEAKCFLALNMQIVHTPPCYLPISPLIQKRFGTETLHGNKMFPSLKYDWLQLLTW